MNFIYNMIYFYCFVILLNYCKCSAVLCRMKPRVCVCAQGKTDFC